MTIKFHCKKLILTLLLLIPIIKSRKSSHNAKKNNSAVTLPKYKDLIFETSFFETPFNASDLSTCSLSAFSNMLSSFLIGEALLNSTTCNKAFREKTLHGSCSSYRFYSQREAMQMLNNSHVLAIGDSITRRLFESLHDFIVTGTTDLRKDDGKHQEADYSARSNASAFSVAIIFEWAPTMNDKLAILRKLQKSKKNRPNFLFIGGPDHDLSYADKVTPKEFYNGLGELLKWSKKLSSMGVSVIIDGVLHMHHKDSVFYELKAAHLLYSSLFIEQSILGYIDMWDWVVKEENSKCMKRDKMGIHFVNDFVRHLHAQTFLNLVEYFKFQSHNPLSLPSSFSPSGSPYSSKPSSSFISTHIPTGQPTSQPSRQPSCLPSSQPSTQPTSQNFSMF